LPRKLITMKESALRKSYRMRNWKSFRKDSREMKFKGLPRRKRSRRWMKFSLTRLRSSCQRISNLVFCTLTRTTTPSLSPTIRLVLLFLFMFQLSRMCPPLQRANGLFSDLTSIFQEVPLYNSLTQMLFLSRNLLWKTSIPRVEERTIWLPLPSK
jgi:hypothetical protein